MSTSAEVDELYQLIGSLRRCVTSLASRYRYAPAVRRVLNDIDRLDIDADELELAHGLTQPKVSSEMIQIPDTQYDIDFWQDVDHEGIGGQIGACAGISHTRKRR